MTGMRVLREVAERGSFTAAASALGYTQSAVSRQVAALEAALGVAVFQRQRTGVRLTAPGRAVLRHATAALDEIDAALRAVRGPAPATEVVRLGAFTSAGAVLVPRTLAALRRTHPQIEVTTREGSTPALVRAVRAGSLDLVVVATTPPFRALDGESPELVVRLVSESELYIAVPATHPLALGDACRHPATGRPALDRQPVRRRRGTARRVARAGWPPESRAHHPGLAGQAAPGRGRLRSHHDPRFAAPGGTGRGPGVAGARWPAGDPPGSHRPAGRPAYTGGTDRRGRCPRHRRGAQAQFLAGARLRHPRAAAGSRRRRATAGSVRRSSDARGRAAASTRRRSCSR